MGCPVCVIRVPLVPNAALKSCPAVSMQRTTTPFRKSFPNIDRMRSEPNTKRRDTKEAAMKIHLVEVLYMFASPSWSFFPVMAEKEGASDAPRESAGIPTPCARRLAIA